MGRVKEDVCVWSDSSVDRDVGGVHTLSYLSCLKKRKYNELTRILRDRF